MLGGDGHGEWRAGGNEDGAGPAGGRSDLTGRAGAKTRIGISEVNRIQYVRSLRPEFQAPPLRKTKSSGEAHVDSDESRTFDTSRAQITQGASGRQRERRRVQVLAEAWAVNIGRDLAGALACNPAKG